MNGRVAKEEEDKKRAEAKAEADEKAAEAPTHSNTRHTISNGMFHTVLLPSPDCSR